MTDRLCSVPGCTRPHLARDLCGTHYARVRRAALPRQIKRRPTTEERFWTKVDKRAEPNGCWIWTGALNGCGYGAFTITNGRPHGQQIRAHRFAFELLIGPIPDALPLDHTCGRRACVNPDHLEPVTIAENIRRAAREQTHCRRAGHPLTGDNVRINVRGARVCRACQRKDPRSAAA